ncbi:MAG: DDE-type integrase/transposase/recombinase [Planctomycetota bacterium]
MMRDLLREACWRFEQISSFLDSKLTGAERRRMILAAGRVCVRWPSGREAPVPPRTLYRWLGIYRKTPRVESLMRSPRQAPEKKTIAPEWLQYALAQLEEEPRRSLFILGLRIKQRFGLDKAPTRSSLHRAFLREPRYSALRRRQKGHGQLRRRFQAARPHEIWHADAKAIFTVRFVNGTVRQLRILSILDDATRFILAALVVESESLAAAVAVFLRAAARWGLPDKFYADRGSAYDADAFRKGLAVLGIHRINTRPRNAPAHGKIEAYHRSLQRWFIAELVHQPVRDIAHLQELLAAFLDRVYHEHVHRELRQTPRAAFNDAISARLVTLARLREAFLIEQHIKAHPATGELRVAGKLFLVPKRFLEGRSRRLTIVTDPEDAGLPLLVVSPGVYEPLVPAFKTPEPKTMPADNLPEPVGPLTPMLEAYRGRSLPQAHGGFGLPEIYEAFARTLGRHVPETEAEATLVLEWLADNGPFDPKAFALALAKVRENLGNGRPLAQIIRALDRQIVRKQNKEELL